MKISIVVPVWEFHGRGNEFLDDLLKSIVSQTHEDLEVIISDHSKDDCLLETIGKYSSDLDILHIMNCTCRGNSPANLNYGLKRASGEIVKIMFQDDFFYDNTALEKINKAFESEISWLVCGCNHFDDVGKVFYWRLKPVWDDNVLEGKNNLGSPSTIAARKIVFDTIHFDEKLVMLMDCEFLYHAKKIFGLPFVCEDMLITSRVHPDRISSRFMKNENAEKLLAEEIYYCKNKHGL